MNACTRLIRQFRNELSNGTQAKPASTEHFFALIEEETTACDTPINSTPVELIKTLTQGVGAIRGIDEFQHPDGSLHAEAAHLVELGFCHLTENKDHLQLNHDLYFALELLDKKQHGPENEYKKALRTFLLD